MNLKKSVLKIASTLKKIKSKDDCANLDPSQRMSSLKSADKKLSDLLNISESTSENTLENTPSSTTHSDDLSNKNDPSTENSNHLAHGLGKIFSRSASDSDRAQANDNQVSLLKKIEQSFGGVKNLNWKNIYPTQMLDQLFQTA